MSDAVLSHETLARIGAGDLESLTDEYGRIIEPSRYGTAETMYLRRDESSRDGRVVIPRCDSCRSERVIEYHERHVAYSHLVTRYYCQTCGYEWYKEEAKKRVYL